jgi:hypothetical protein
MYKINEFLTRRTSFSQTTSEQYYLTVKDKSIFIVTKYFIR